MSPLYKLSLEINATLAQLLSISYLNVFKVNNFTKVISQMLAYAYGNDFTLHKDITFYQDIRN